MEDYIELYSGLNASILVLSLSMTFARTTIKHASKNLESLKYQIYRCFYPRKSICDC